MDPLAAEAKLVTDPLKRNTLRAKCENLGVSLNVRGWTGRERPPFPSGDGGEGCCSLRGKQSRSLALPDIADPRSEVDASPVFDGFYVRDRDSCVSVPLYVGVEGGEVLVPFLLVLHGGNRTSSG